MRLLFNNRAVAGRLGWWGVAWLAGVTSLSLGVASAAWADQDNTAPANNDLLHRSTMTGDWGGARTRLKDDYGIDLHAGYNAEYARTLSGGLNGGGDDSYPLQVSFGADVDTGKLLGWPNGLFRLQFNYRHGDNLAAESIGSHSSVQEGYGAGQNFRLSNISYQQSFAHEQFVAQVGFYPLGNHFGTTTVLCKFQSGNACGHLKTLPSSSGWNDYPTGQWGGRLQYNVTDNAYAEVGVYEVNPSYGTHNHGFKLGFSDSTGAIFPVEVGYTTALGDKGLPGHYKIGAYYDTSDAPDVVHADEEHNDRYGIYAFASQMMFSFGGSNDRGLIAFSGFGYSDKKTAVYQNTEVAGLIAQGPLAVRPNDFLAVGYFRAGLNERAQNAHQAAEAIDAGSAMPGEFQSLAHGEDVFEVGYGLQATPWLLINPNFQYINDPGAFSYRHINDSYVFGLRTTIKL